MTYAIETHNLTRRFANNIVVDQLNLAINTGTVFGFLGPNGAGKTTTVRMLTALIAPTSGSATVLGKQLGHDDHAIRRSVGMLTETPGLYDKLSARQNLLFFGQLYDLSQQQAQQQTDHFLKTLGLWERRDDPVGTFSKGMRQKLAIARALLHEPKLVFLDEPTSGLDPEATRMVRDFIQELRAEGRTIFLTTHNLPEADELCDQIGVFQRRLLHIDTIANLRASQAGNRVKIVLASAAEPWLALVQGLPFITAAEAAHNTITATLSTSDRDNPTLVRVLVAANADIRYLEPLQYSLEATYLQLIRATNAAIESVGDEHV
jgi:ABC-2 type transport system ATP-binding protein